MTYSRRNQVTWREALAFFLVLWVIFPVYAMMIPLYTCELVTNKDRLTCWVDFWVWVGAYERIEK